MKHNQVRTFGALLVVLLAFGAAGCGASVSVGSHNAVSGPALAKLANKQLEKNNPQMTQGKLTCKALEAKVKATAPCRRTVDLSEGRRVVIGVTTTVTKVSSGNHILFNIQVAPKPDEFGLEGAYVAQDLATQYKAKYGTAADKVTCPYLLGKVGTVVKCTLTADGTDHTIEVTATAVDQKNFNTDYTFKADSLATPPAT